LTDTFSRFFGQDVALERLLKRLAAPRRVFNLAIVTSFRHLFGAIAPLQNRPAGKEARIL